MPTPLLFLIADTGGGHRAAATAVARQLARDRPGDFDVSVVDPVKIGSAGVLGRTADLYAPLIRHGRWLWGTLYHSTNSRPAVSVLQGTALRPLRTTVAALLERFHPAVVVSFHPLLNHVAARTVTDRAPGVPVITVITDLVDIHASWACRDVDAVVIPSPGGLDRCRRAGIPAERCHMLGLAVDAAFTRPRPDDPERRRLRRSLGLDGDRFTVLVCSGADGSGNIEGRVRALATADIDVDLAVVCGHNHQAAARLQGLRDRHGRPVLVHGFIHTMADWMRAADVVVTKAGPGTISEAMCSGLPLLLTWYLPGQESGNVEWVIDVGAGRYVPGLEQLVDAVAELSRPGSPALAAMRGAAHSAARPDSTRRIAALIAEMATADARPR